MSSTSQILLIGDLIIDRTWRVDVTRLSPEGPIPTGELLSPEATDTPGGAGLAATYAKRHNIPLTFLTAASIETTGWLNTAFRITTHQLAHINTNVTKTRFIDTKSNYHLLRIDNDRVAERPQVDLRDVTSHLIRLAITQDIAACAILDYRKGLLADPNVCHKIISILKQRDIPIYVDTRAQNLEKFSGVDWLKLNDTEFNKAQQHYQTSFFDDLVSHLGIENLIVTHGARGASIHSLSNTITHTPVQHTNGAPDVTGCGDVFDISFCHARYQQQLDANDALVFAVEHATEYAWEPIGERLNVYVI